MLIYPQYPLKSRKNRHSHQTELWDIVRKKWVLLTPEEYVRQHFIHYLIYEKHYPQESILVEKEINLFHTKKRFDVAVLNKEQRFLLVAECKAPTVVLDARVLEQIFHYNIPLNAETLVITNGIKQYVFEKHNQGWKSVEDIKIFNDYS